jgi:hypothetical protein
MALKTPHDALTRGDIAYLSNVRSNMIDMLTRTGDDKDRDLLLDAAVTLERLLAKKVYGSVDEKFLDKITNSYIMDGALTEE